MARPRKRRRGKKRGNKADAQKIHFNRRVAARVGVALTQNDYARIIRDIMKGEAKTVKKESNRLSHFLVEIGGQERTVVFDRFRKALVTVLPEEGDLMFSAPATPFTRGPTFPSEI